VRLGREAVLRNSVVGDDSRIGDRCVVEECLLSGGVAIPEGKRLKPGSRVFPPDWQGSPSS
jgi:ADP-glucose pyrophosphorylase